MLSQWEYRKLETAHHQPQTDRVYRNVHEKITLLRLIVFVNPQIVTTLNSGNNLLSVYDPPTRLIQSFVFIKHPYLSDGCACANLEIDAKKTCVCKR